MIDKNVEKAMNEQIVHEIYSAYLYLAMGAYFESLSLKGAAHWMRCQAQEELIHAMKFYMHIIDRTGRVELGAIGKPPVDWASPLAAFQAANKHEQLVTSLINNIVNIADAAKDHAARPILNWFVNEQIEEEAQTDEIAQKLKLAGKSVEGLFSIDKDLSMRVFTYPTVLPGNLGGVAA